MECLTSSQVLPTGNKGGGRPSSTTAFTAVDDAELPELPDLTILARGPLLAVLTEAKGLSSLTGVAFGAEELEFVCFCLPMMDA